MIRSGAEILAHYLVAAGLGSWPPETDDDPYALWTVTWSAAPKIPKKWMSVLKDETDMHLREMQGGSWTEYPGFQIQFRAETDPLVLNKARDVCVNLDAVSMAPVTVDAVVYTIQNVSRKTDPTFLKEEEDGDMRVFFVNGRLTILET